MQYIMPAKNKYIKFASQKNNNVGKRKKPLFENIRIEGIGAEGKAITRVKEKVLFVPYGIPGDVVDVQVTKSRKNYYEGFITNFHTKSENRNKAFCSHFGLCGGCKWQELPYQEQLKYKQKQVVDNFERIGGVKNFETKDIIAAEKTVYYRNKLEYTFSDSRWLTKDELGSGNDIIHRDALGFHIPGKFDKILDIETCYLQQEPSNSIRLAIKEFAVKNNYSFFNIINQEGFLRNLIIRTTKTGEIMVILSLFYEDKEKREELLQYIQNKFPQITSLLYVINKKKNETLFDQRIEVFSGRDYIIEEIDNLKFKIGPKSFFQTNSEQTEKLYKVAADMAGAQQNETIYDLYCGIGTITNYLARYCKNIVGIELIPEAIDDAWQNAKMNKIENIDFYAGDVKDILNEPFILKFGKPDIIMVDPPRAGLSPAVIDMLLTINCSKIIYISCNPATQARDISMLNKSYSLEKIQPVDMFPHTHHVENIAKLTIK